MVIEISIPPVVFVESQPPRYFLALSLESTEVKAVLTRTNDKTWHAKLLSPCRDAASSREAVIVDKTYVEPRLNFSSYCIAEKALLNILSRIKDEDLLLKLDDFADILSLDEQKVIKSVMLGGTALFFSSERYSSVAPLIYLPPPPRIQVVLATNKRGKITYNAETEMPDISTLVNVLGLISSVWKDDVALMDELLGLITMNLYGDSDYLRNPPLIPLVKENLYLSFLPRTDIGCPTKLRSYRYELFKKIEKEEMIYNVMNISSGVKITVTE